jgi:biopolymer transport protein ExbD
MAMTTGNGPNGISSSINVTPLIDVLLVLLIIFMVIVPVTPKGLGAQLPQPPEGNGSLSKAVVVSVLGAGGSGVTYKINQEDVAKNELLPRLTAIYASRADRVMFVRGDNEVQYSQIAEVIDAGHSAGVDRVGLMTPNVLAGR